MSTVVSISSSKMFNLSGKKILPSKNRLFNSSELTFWQKVCVLVLKQGPIPRHVAIIMDGNRRFARANNVEQIEGHSAGYSTLLNVMSWCIDLGIKELTVYAFSIENFKRSPEELNNLFNLIRDKFESLWRKRNDLMQMGICVRAIGNLLLFTKDLQKAIAKVVTFTKNNSKNFLNFAISYTSREEMFSSVRKVLDGVQEGIINPQEINEELFNKCLYTCESAELDLLIRTSGEVRLSDFLLWQSTYSMLMFVKCLWPEFSFWELMFAVFSYQNQYHKIKIFKDKRFETDKEHVKSRNGDDAFLQYLNRGKQNMFYAMLNSNDDHSSSSE